jgi:hypothetical protein
MTDFPVRVEIHPPARFDRVQLAIRVVLALVLGWLGITAGWVACALYLVLPLIVAIALSSHPADYPANLGPRLWRAVSWLLALSAYMMFLTDRPPLREDPALQIELRITGKPTTGTALARLLTSIPSGFVLALLWLVSGVLWLVSAFTVVIGREVPAGILAFQGAVLRWEARLAAYHASLVDEYPPFMLDTREPPSVTAERPAG